MIQTLIESAVSMDYLKLKISPTATQNCPNKFWKIEQTILDQNIVIFNNIDILFSKYLKKYFPTCIGCHRKTAVFYYFQLGIEICTCTHSRKALWIRPLVDSDK